MSLKNKTFQIILRVICGLFLVLAIFLSVTAVVYSTGGGTPNIFGTNVYLVKTDAFGFLKNGTAIMAKSVPPAEIQSTNIVIFTLENGKPALAQVLHSELYDGVYSFKVLTENNAEITLSQSQIVAKGMNYSDFWGALIRFAISPLGMLLIAIVPCIIIIIIEIVKFAGNFMPQPEIETVKKQYEVPSYDPESDRPARERRGTAEAVKAYRNSSLDSSIGIYEPGRGEPPAASKPVHNPRNEYAEIAARQQQQQSPLFTNPVRPSAARQTQASRNTMPLSSKKLNEAIEQIKGEHELEDMKKVRSQVVKDIQKTRGAAIAAEKEYETSERLISQAARRTQNIAKTTVFNDLSEERAANLSEAASRTAAQTVHTAQSSQPSQPTLTKPGNKPGLTPPKRTQRPPLKLGQEENVKQYTPRSGSGATNTTNIPRLDSLLQDDSDKPYNIDDILAGLDRKRG